MGNKRNYNDLMSKLEGLTDFESTEITNMFKVKEEELFVEIANRIYSENDVFVIKKDGKVGLFTHGSLSNCIPLEIPDEELDSYDGEFESTLKHLQLLLNVGDEIILNSTLYDKKAKEVTIEITRVTAEKSEYIQFNQKNSPQNC